MSKYFNPRLLNAVIAGTGMKNPVRPHVVLGDQANGFIRGDLMDANAIVEIADQKIKELVDSAPEALDTLKELAAALNDDSNFATTIVNAINQKQDTLISGENIKTINGSSILGEGNIVLDTSTYKGLPETWDTTHSMAELIASINADETAIPGKSYLGTVQLSDLPAGMVQAELIIDIMDQLDVDGSKVIVFSLSSADISPYKWEYTSAYGRAGAWRSWATAATLATVASTGSYTDLINKPTIPDAQIQSDWNQSNTTAKDYIKNKPEVALKSDLYSQPDPNGHAYVDLGLPSGTLWATMNVGASSETGSGDYYMYGKGSSIYNSSDTTYAGTENPLSLSVDTARQVWGGDWHTPTST